jgi:hypothetical protein
VYPLDHPREKAMKKRTRLAAIVGAGLLALPLSACAEDDPDVVIDEEETSEVVPEDDGDTGTGTEEEGDTGTEDGMDDDGMEEDTQ